MIKNIVFDFGDVFINLDKEVVFRAMELNKTPQLLPELDQLNKSFEVGDVSPDEFLQKLHAFFPDRSVQQIEAVWNAMLLDFPEHRLEFIETMARENQYRLFLLSNTNALHIPFVRKQMGVSRFERFKKCFEKFYLSHEIRLRKPSKEIFHFVLKENSLRASETLFIDDTKENTEGAGDLGIATWHLKVGLEDIVQLKSRL